MYIIIRANGPTLRGNGPRTNVWHILWMIIDVFKLFFDILCDCTASKFKWGAVVVVIVWLLDLQLPMQSVPIITKVVSSNRAHGEVYSILNYVIKVCQWLAAGCWFSSGTPVSSTSKTDRHDNHITEILSKVP